MANYLRTGQPLTSKLRGAPLALANHTGLSERELGEAERVVARHYQEIIDAWNKHFGG